MKRGSEDDDGGGGGGGSGSGSGGGDAREWWWQGTECSVTRPDSPSVNYSPFYIG